MSEKHLSAAEAVKYIEETHGLKIAEATFLSKISRGQGPKHHKFGRHKVFLASLLTEWVNEQLGEPARTSRELAARRATKSATVTAIAPRKRASRKRGA